MRRKSVCFISETSRGEEPLQDPSVRYRAYHPAEVLMARGHICAIYSALQFYRDPNFTFDVYVFHRPNAARPGFSEVLALLQRFNRQLIADYDDLIFGESEIALASSAVRNGTLPPDKAVSAFESNTKALRAFSRVTTSTSALAAQARRLHPEARIEVQPNILPEAILTFHARQRTWARRRPSYRIGYFAGTKSHDHDLPVLEAALHRVLSEDSRRQLLVVGPVAMPATLAALPNVTVAPVVNYLRLPGLMSGCHTVIAPLEDSLFNACKSRVKFLEAALSGCHLIATPIPDMQEIGPDHLTLAASQDDWYEALSEPLEGRRRDAMMGRNFEFLQSRSTVNSLIALGELA